MRDHRGNGKIEQLIRTINERVRTNKNRVLKKDKSGLSETLNALRMGEKADGKSPFENLYGRKPNTVKSNNVDRRCFRSRSRPKVLHIRLRGGSRFSDIGEGEDSRVQIGKPI